MSGATTWEGRYYEDFVVGERIKHPYGKTVTEADNHLFSLITLALNEIHFNEEYAGCTEYRRPLVNSCLTLALVTGLSVMDISQNAINLGWREVRLLNPVYVGDTLYAESEVLEKRESRSRPEMGIVSVRTRGYNQKGVPVIEFTRTVMVWKRSHAPRTKLLQERARRESPG